MNIDAFKELYGYFLLVEAGEVVYNPQYMWRYGHFMYNLAKLSYSKRSAESIERLRKSYQYSADSARFFATYPKDLSKLSRKEKYNLRFRHKG